MNQLECKSIYHVSNAFGCILWGVPQHMHTHTHPHTYTYIYFTVHPMPRIKGGCLLSPSDLPIVAMEDQHNVHISMVLLQNDKSSLIHVHIETSPIYQWISICRHILWDTLPKIHVTGTSTSCASFCHHYKKWHAFVKLMHVVWILSKSWQWKTCSKTTCSFYFIVDSNLIKL